MAILEKQRFDVRLDSQLAGQFDAIAARTGLSRAEIFRRALYLYAKAKEETLNNGKVLLEDAGGNRRELINL